MNLRLCILLPLATLLVACSGSGGGSKSAGIYQPDFGPFDENGDYIEELADAPAKKNFFSRSSRQKPDPEPVVQSPPRLIAKKETPRPTRPVEVAQTTPRVISRRVIATETRTMPTTTAARSPQPTVVTRTVTATPPKPKPVTTPKVESKPKPTPKPEAVVVKPKSNPPVRHRVTASDTLYGLSRKYGTSVSAIQKANNLRGNTIVTGSTLLIPR